MPQTAELAKAAALSDSEVEQPGRRTFAGAQDA